MRKILYSLSISFIFVLSFFAFTASAQTTPIQSNPIQVATVNVYNAKIVSQTTGSINVGFDIFNRIGVQPDVRYSVNLFKKLSNGGSVLFDQKVYDEVLSLGENQTIHREVAYSLPPTNGQYEVWVVSASSDAFPFGQGYAGNVDIKNTAGYVELSSCFLTVKGDSKNEYSLGQGVDVASDESLSINCVAQNNFKTAVVATPSFETHARSVFGQLNQTASPSDTISFTAGENKNIVVEIPKATAPQSYDATFLLKDAGNNQISNSETAHYVIQGESATVQNVVLDKTSYQAGDTMGITLLWSGPADMFPNSRLIQKTNPTESPKTSVEITVSSAGTACISPIVKDLSSDNAMVNFSEKVLAQCDNPIVSVKLLDSTNKVLTDKNLSFTTTNSTGSNVVVPNVPSVQNSNMIVPIAIVILSILIIVLVVYRKKTKINPNIPLSIFFLFALFASTFFFARSASADTFTDTAAWGLQGSRFESVNVYTVNLDKYNYFPGDIVNVTESVTSSLCNNSVYDFSADATVNNVTKNIFSVTGFVPGGAYGHESYQFLVVSQGQANFTAPSVPGQYVVHLSSTANSYAAPIYNVPIYTISASYDMSYNVVCASGTWNGSSCVAIPTVTTAPVSAVTQSSAIGGGTIVNNGGGPISLSGILWGVSSDPTQYNGRTTDGLASGGPWSDTMTNLLPSTLYHYRAYAVNNVGIGYGDDLTFTTGAAPITTPPNLTATPSSCGTRTINISWGTPATGTSGNYGYILRDYRTVIFSTQSSSSSAASALLATGTGTGPVTSFSHTGLGTSTVHSYTIQASNDFSTSAISSPVLATAPANCTFPTVAISINPTSGTVNMVNPTISWSANNNPISCTASGDWATNGAKAISGAQSQGVLSIVKTYTYTLSCANANGSGSPASATITVDAAPVMSGTLTPATYSCVIGLGASSCPINFAWTTTNPVGTSGVRSDTTDTGTYVSNTQVSSPDVNSGTQAFIIPYLNNGSHTGRNFYLYNSGVLLAQTSGGSITTSCAGGTGWNGTSCQTSTNGVLGTAAGKTGVNSYPYGSTVYAPYTQCLSGTPDNTAFPAAGNSATWICLGSNGGTNSGPGTASQIADAAVSLTASPNTTIYQGSSTTLIWSSTAPSCTGTNFNTGGAASGSLVITPLITTTYTVTCNSQSSSATVTVKKKPIIIEN